jgi:hypothetical protein
VKAEEQKGFMYDTHNLLLVKLAAMAAILFALRCCNEFPTALYINPTLAHGCY